LSFGECDKEKKMFDGNVMMLEILV